MWIFLLKIRKRERSKEGEKKGRKVGKENWGTGEQEDPG